MSASSRPGSTSRQRDGCVVCEPVHPLAEILDRAAAGSFPPADGRTDVLPPDDDGTLAIVAFTGHAYVLGDVDPRDVASRQSDRAGGGFGGALAPAMQQWLAGGDREIGSIDVVLAAAGGPAPAGSLMRRDDHRGHPRVRRAMSHRRDVEVYGDDNGLAILGRGLVGRWELSVELFDTTALGDGSRRGPPAGAGRRLVAAGLELVPDGEWCWAQVAAGNARSLRAFLACGFVPVASEVLISPFVPDRAQ